MTQNKWTLLTADDLRTWRLENGFSRKQLGFFFRVTPGAIRAFERGDEAPPEWLQDRMAGTICADALPEIAIPRRHFRRHRWTKITGTTIYLWRTGLKLKQSEAAVILGVCQTSVSRWERNACAPPVEMQAALRAAMDGYDAGNFPKPASGETGPTEKPTETEKEMTIMSADEKDESVAKRARALMEGIDAIKLPERTAECRWGRADGFVVVRSNVSGAHYLWDAVDGQFFRTKHPRSSQIQSDTPRGVIHEDRQWLYPLLNRIPEGKKVVQRYHDGGVAAAAAAPEPAAPTGAVHPTQVAAMHGLVDLKPQVEKKEVIVVKNSGKLVVRLDHLMHLLKLAAVEIPTGASCSVDSVTFSWTLPDETLA